MVDSETSLLDPNQEDTLITQQSPSLSQLEQTDQTISSTDPERPQTEFILNSTDNFTEKLTEFSELSAEALQYVIEKQQTNFTQMNSEEAAALLLVAEKTVKPEMTKQLQTRVRADITAQDFYYTEKIKILDIPQLEFEIANFDTAIQSGMDVSPRQLDTLLQTIQARSTELAPLIENNQDLQEALERLNQNWESREQKIAGLTKATQEADSGVGIDVPEGAVVETVERTGDELTTTIKKPDGGEQKVVIKEVDVWKLLLIVTASDALLGTRSLRTIADTLIRHQVAAPLLSKLGIDPTELFQKISSKDFQPFDGMLKVMDDRTCEKYFKDAIEKNFLYEILKQTNSEHIQKMFAPEGTKSFGSSGFLSYDHLHLNQELVNEMYKALSERQREELRIPPLQEASST